MYVNNKLDEDLVFCGTSLAERFLDKNHRHLEKFREYCKPGTFINYCKRANIRGGFNFAMFAVDDFPAKLKPPRSFYNTSVYSHLWLHVHLKIPNPRN